MSHKPIRFSDKFALFEDQWAPRVIAEMNDYQFKLVKVQGEFVWHDHADTDEVFIVIEGRLEIEFQDGKVALGAGEMFVVPRGKLHRPCAGAECKIMLVEPKGIVNTGTSDSDLRAENDVWI